MVDTGDILMGYWVYKNVLEEKEDDSDYKHDNEEYVERQEEIEDIMTEYGVDEEDAEEILDNM